MASTLATPIAQAVISLFDGNLGKLLNYGYRPGYGILGATLIDWTPADLFLLGEQGAWYDPSDLTTMYQDAAGTTPVTAVEQPVGLMLDKSKGLVLGAERVVNGGFDSGTGWTLHQPTAGSVAISGGSLRINSTDVSNCSANRSATISVIGKTYKITFDILANVAGAGVVINYGGTATSAITGTGSKTVYVVAAAAGGYFEVKRAGGVTDITIDNISVRELPGNHATQATAASRPLLSARVNLLTYSEQFDNAAWGKSNVTVTANAAVAPDGTTTADKAIGTAVAAAHSLIENIVALPTATSGVGTVYAKAAELSTLYFSIKGAGTGARYKFTLSGAGTVVSDYLAGNSSTSASITDVGNGWYRCQVVATPTSVGLSAIEVMPSGLDGSFTTVGDGTSGIYIWGAQLETGSTATRYQRVDSASSYDSVGFPYYLKFDGVDDSLATASIDFTATDKMTVFAGVRKLSDAALGMLVELSTTRDANLGSFDLRSDAGGSWSSLSHGAAAASAGQNVTTATYAAPESSVLSSLNDIAGDLTRLRRNGTEATPATGDKGSGDFLAYPLYIGRRGGISFPFNGHLYSLIVRGAQSTDAQIVAAEAWVNNKTGAY